jgi:hypothetical protein
LTKSPGWEGKLSFSAQRLGLFIGCAAERLQNLNVEFLFLLLIFEEWFIMNNSFDINKED